MSSESSSDLDLKNLVMLFNKLIWLGGARQII